MKILHQNNIGFAIAENGEITCSSNWEVIADAIDDWTDFEAAVKSWAGNPGEGWRVPDADSEGYSVDTTRVITGIDCTAKSRWIYDVAFKGRVRDLTARMTDFSETINNKDEREKTATWSVDADSLDGFLPEIGAVMTWAGELFYCDNISSKKVGITEGRYEVTLTAIDLSQVMLGNPSFSRNEKYESTKSATWKVSNDAYEAFIDAHDVNSDASSWAGEGYYVTSIKADPRGKLGYDVAVEAKHIGVRCLETRREETFKGYDAGGNPIREIKWSGRWQVSKDNIEDFQNITGDSAADWADEGYIITNISPNQISDMEYEFSLEAKNPDNASIPKTEDDRSKLSERKDYYPGSAEFKIDAKMAGWTEQDGMLKKMNEVTRASWDPAKDCPFEMTTEMDKKYVEKVITCVTVQLTSYWKGDPMTQIANFKATYELNSIASDLYGNIGSWRVTKKEGEKILDNNGDPWTKFTATFICAPFTFKWNASYWGI